MIKKCNFCDESMYDNDKYTRYSEFSMNLTDNVLKISDDYGHDDTIDIKYCPICGREL